MDPCAGLLDLDFDQDVLINLLGKLSLDNIPDDIADTLLSLENRSNASASAATPEIWKPEECLQSLSFPEIPDPSIASSSALPPPLFPESGNDIKNDFLSSIGLVCDKKSVLSRTSNSDVVSNQDKVVTESNLKSEFAFEPSEIIGSLKHHHHQRTTDKSLEITDQSSKKLNHSPDGLDLTKHKSCHCNKTPVKSHEAVHVQSSSKKKDSRRTRKAKTDATSNNKQNNSLPPFVDLPFTNLKTEFTSNRKQNNSLPPFVDLPFTNLKTEATSNKKQNNSLPPSVDLPFTNLYSVFSQKGKVFDIQLCDLNTERSLSPEELSSDESSKTDSDVVPVLTDGNDSSELSLLLLEKSDNHLDKLTSLPDSGYDTSSCSSAVSPCSFVNVEGYFEDYDDELDDIVAAIVEAENSMPHLEGQSSNSSIPILKNAKNPEEHKEKLIIFLKEPIFCDSPSPLSNSSDAESFSPSKLVLENSPKSCSKSSSHSKTPKKSPPKVKDWKAGYDFKFTSRSKHGCYYVFVNRKNCERSKILKQVQDDHTQKKLKVIEYVDSRTKRTAIDDRENLKRRKIWICKEENIK